MYIIDAIKANTIKNHHFTLPLDFEESVTIVLYTIYGQNFILVSLYETKEFE